MTSPTNAAHRFNFWYLLITIVIIPPYTMLNSPQSVVSGQPTALFCNYTFNTSFITDKATLDEDDENALPNVLCSVKLIAQTVTVRSDRKPVLNEDCEHSPAACLPDGTFVMQLSMLPLQANQALAFAAMLDVYTELGHFNLTETGLFNFRPARNRHGRTAVSLPINVVGANCTTFVQLPTDTWLATWKVCKRFLKKWAVTDFEKQTSGLGCGILPNWQNMCTFQTICSESAFNRNSSIVESGLAPEQNAMLHVVAQPDPPNLFVLSSELKLIGQHPSSISAATAADSDWLIVEQNSASNAAYRDLQFVFGAFDSDYDSANPRGYYLSPRILSRPQFGKLFIEQSYEFLGTGERAAAAASNAACQSATEAFQLYECLPFFVLDGAYSQVFKWMFTTLRYQPYETYTGSDSFEIAVEKSLHRSGTQFYRTRVLIAVLENLCENNSTCVGHAQLNRDIHCTSPLRRTGFDRLHYRCLCIAGWTGSHCEKQLPIAVEDSSSTLTPREFTDATATDTSDAYLSDQQVAACSCLPPYVCSVTNQCECPSYDPSCDDQSIKSWQIAMIVVFSGIIVICITVAIIIYSQKGNSFFN